MKWLFWKKVDFLVLSDGGKIVDCQDLLQWDPSKQKYPETVRSRILLCFSWFSFNTQLQLVFFRVITVSFIYSLCGMCLLRPQKPRGVGMGWSEWFFSFSEEKIQIVHKYPRKWLRSCKVAYAYKRHIMTPSFLSCNFAKAQLIKINKKTSFIPLFQVKYNWIVKW